VAAVPGLFERGTRRAARGLVPGLLLTSPRNRTIAALAGLSLYVAIYSFVWPSAPLLSARDSQEYIDYAARLLHGSFSEPHYRLPGYPLLLALLGGSDVIASRSLFFFQLITHVVGIGLLASVLKRLGVRRPLRALFAGLMLLPPFVDSAAFILTESFTGFLLAGFFYCLVRWLLDRAPKDAWIAGCFAAAVFLVRPVYLLLAAFLVGILYLTRGRRPSLHAAIGLATPSILACAVIIGINYAAFGYGGLTPKTGFMLFTRTLTFLERIPDSEADVREVLIRSRDRSLTVRGSSHTGTQFLWEGGMAELVATTGKSRTALSRDMLRLNVKLIAGEPLQYAAVVARSVSDLWFPSATRLSFFGNPYLQLGWAILHLILVALYFFALAGAAARMFVLTARGTEVLPVPSPSLHLSSGAVEALLHATIWYTCLVSAAVEVGEPRYMRPVLPLAAATVALFLVRWQDLRQRRRFQVSESGEQHTPLLERSTA